MAPRGGRRLHALLLLCSCIQWSRGFIAVSPYLRECSHKTLSSADEVYKRESRRTRRAGLIRRRPRGPGFSLRVNKEGGPEEDDENDTLELTKGFYSEVAARLGNPSKGVSVVEEDTTATADDKGSGNEFDKAIYDELRARRDFGFEQDLGLELEKRNITKEAKAKQIVDAGLEQMPGVSSSTTFLPTAELTPREVVTSVFEALRKNNQPYPNHGVEVFIRFLAPSSAMHGVGMAGVARYLAENRNRSFMHWETMAFPRPLTLSGGTKQNKAFQPVKLKDTMTGAWHSVSVYLMLDARSNCWLIESCIVKGEL